MPSIAALMSLSTRSPRRHNCLEPQQRRHNYQQIYLPKIPILCDQRAHQELIIPKKETVNRVITWVAVWKGNGRSITKHAKQIAQRLHVTRKLIYRLSLNTTKYKTRYVNTSQQSSVLTSTPLEGTSFQQHQTAVLYV